MKKSIASVALASVLVLGASGAAFAQDAAAGDPGHPRVNQVEQRIQNQEDRVNEGIASGKIDAKEAAKDEAKLSREQKSLAKDEAKHHGHLTKAEQVKLNKHLNKGSKTIDGQEDSDAPAVAK